MNPINFLGKGFRKFANIFWKNSLNSSFENSLKSNVSNKSCDVDSEKTSLYRERTAFEELDTNKTGMVVPRLNYIYKYFDPTRKKYTDRMTTNNINNRVCKVEISANNPSEDRCNALQLKNLKGYFAAVFDGHGGDAVADYAKKELHKKFDENYQVLKEDSSILEKQKIILAMYKAFEEVEQGFYTKALEKYQQGDCKWAYVGSCALVTVVKDNLLLVANLGDCKARLFRRDFDGEKIYYEPIKVTITHNASKFYEQDRLREKFKGEADIIIDKGKACYVKGRLQPTKTLGDFYMKKKEFNQPPVNAEERYHKRIIENFNGPYIESHPDIQVIDLNEEHDFMVLATDGLWDWLDSEDVAEIISENYEDKKNIAESLIKEALTRAANRGDLRYEQLMHLPQEIKRSIHDDITILVVDLKNQVTYKSTNLQI